MIAKGGANGLDDDSGSVERRHAFHGERRNALVEPIPTNPEG